MKVYFACSITGGRDHAHLYQDIVSSIKDAGGDLLSELFADQSITDKQGVGMKKGMAKQDIWQWDLDWVKEADVIIAEVTQPSLGVGYEIAKAEGWKKPILALFYEPSGKRLSAMIEGSPRIQTAYYSTTEQADNSILKFIEANS